MIKDKKLIIILMVFTLSAALLNGCGIAGEGEAGINGESGITGSNEVTGDTTDQTAEDENAGQTETQPQSQSTATINGTLKAADAAAGTVTITTKDGDELVLKVTSESKIQLGDSPATSVQLDTKIGSEASIEYQLETKTVTAINIKG